MTIHHATIKRAEKHNIELSEVETSEGTMVRAGDFLQPKAKDALDAAIVAGQLKAEYPAIQLRQADDFDPTLQIWATDSEGQLICLRSDLEQAPTLAETLEIVQDADFDPEQQEPEEEEEKEHGTVVAPRYREIYKERGNPDHCGDWIATMLDGEFTTVGQDGKERFDPDAFLSFLAENEVDLTGRWAKLPEVGTPGWQGRFRMNGRQKLEKVVAHRGTMVIQGKTHEVPDDALADLRAKHPEPKKRKAAMAEQSESAQE